MAITFFMPITIARGSSREASASWRNGRETKEAKSRATATPRQPKSATAIGKRDRRRPMTGRPYDRSCASAIRTSSEPISGLATDVCCVSSHRPCAHNISIDALPLREVSRRLRWFTRCSPKTSFSPSTCKLLGNPPNAVAVFSVDTASYLSRTTGGWHGRSAAGTRQFQLHHLSPAVGAARDAKAHEIRSSDADTPAQTRMAHCACTAIDSRCSSLLPNSGMRTMGVPKWRAALLLGT